MPEPATCWSVAAPPARFAPAAPCLDRRTALGVRALGLSLQRRRGLAPGLALVLEHRLALDVALAHQPQGQDRADERQRGAEHEDLVHPVQEPLLGGVGDRRLRALGQPGYRLAEAAGRRRLDQLAGLAWPPLTAFPASSWVL